ncbi:MAG: hypothetical protein JWO58_192 [Chitinophagaceae bacterium]|nr:hypothetical protein [Chitinophagaceae bacterium]
MEKLLKHTLIVCFTCLCSFVQVMPSKAQITWPAGQLLPSFPATSQAQDLFYLNGSTVSSNRSWQWQAEGASIGHKTGRLETDGWLCQVGIDAPNDHMIYGPYDNSVTAGANVAQFRMKIDNNTANNDPVVDIDVRDATTGATLASQTVTRQQFTIAGDYTTINLPFVMPADNQAIELRVYWRGGSYIKVDWVGVQQDNAAAEMYLFSSLKGVVNRTKPRLFSYEGDAFAEGPYTWMQSLGLTWTEHSNNWELITKYRSEISGLIVYDPAQIHTVNLATTLAKDKKALVASPALLAKLTAAPYNLPVVMDLRGQFTSKLQVYQTLYNTYWPNIDHRLLIGLSPDLHQASLREYASALGAAVIWLDPNVSGESELLNSFLASMGAGSTFMGWWPEEGSGVTRASQYGIATVASDYATNLTVHSGMPRTVNIKPIPPKPALQNKLYVAFIMSDGDNLQYVEHLMRKLWNNPDRGSVPMGWTLSPAMLDAMPGALNYYSQSATTNDNLISGPSGYGYTYPNNWSDQNMLNQFVAKTEDYNRRAGFRVVTVWNTITGGINQNVGQTYATYAPSLLGVTAQNTGGPMSIYNNSLPGFPLSCNYCAQEQNVKDFIASAAAGWDRAEPRFILIQAQPWQDMKPTNFKNVANSLNSDYIVVRPDHMFQLIRESKGLPIDPTPASTTGLVTAYKDCNYAGFSVGLDVGDYKLSDLQSKDILDNDISSLKIAEGYKAILYDGDNFTGASTTITADNACLVNVATNWNDRVTSIQIRTNGVTNAAGTYYVQNRNSGLYMDVWELSTADGANIAQGTFNGGANQQYQFTHLGDGTYQILAKHSGKSVDVNAISTADGANVQQWTYYGTPNQQFIVTSTGDGYYKLIPKHSGKVVEVANASKDNNANIQQWTNNNQTCGMWGLVPVVTTVVTGNGDGLTGNYFNGMNFETPVYNRVDANINVDWGNGSPNAAVNTDGFSARWSGQIQPKYTETYTFHLTTDNGRRLWINGQLIIDKWIDDWGTDYTGTIALVAGQKYDIKLEYFENYGGANAKFEWNSTSQAREVVPQSQLYSNPLPTVSISSPANNASVNAGTITIGANASDNGSIAKVEFYNGATLLGISTSSPYSYSWTGVTAGTYSLTARATDNQGGITVSSVVSLTVKAVVVVNQAPTVSLTSPSNGSSSNAPSSITIAANASDADGTVSKVDFYNGSTLLYSDATSPYSYTWTSVGAGTYIISAKATDNSGATTTSGSVTITVVTVVTNKCTGIAAYKENNGYVAGSKVTNVGEQYECKEYPYSGWCNGAAWAYAPGTGSYWTDAWYDRGSCTARTGQADEDNNSEELPLIVPNPTAGVLTIQLKKPSTIAVYNTLGTEVISSTAIEANGTLDLSNLPDGIYLVKIDSGFDLITQSILKRQ